MNWSFLAVGTGGLWAARDAQPIGDLASEVLPEWIKILPFGTWMGHPSGPFSFGPADVADMLANFAAMGRDLVVDYEHQTLSADLSGHPAPAAAWIDRLEARADGIWAHVRMWTDRAAAFLRSREYRFLSPVLMFDAPDPQSGRKRGVVLHSVALTNSPFLAELPAIMNRSTGGTTMLTWLLACCALPPTTTEAEAKAHVEGLLASRKAACRGLGLPDTATLAEVDAASAQAAGERRMGAVACSTLRLDPAALPADADARLTRELAHSGYVPLDEHARALRDGGTRETALTDAQMLDNAVAKGLVTPVMMSWAADYIRRDREGFRTWAASTPAAVPVGIVPPRREPNTAPDAGLSEVEMTVCRQLSIDPKKFREVNHVAGNS